MKALVLIVKIHLVNLALIVRTIQFVVNVSKDSILIIDSHVKKSMVTNALIATILKNAQNVSMITNYKMVYVLSVQQ